MGKTSNYGLPYFEAGDEVGDIIDMDEIRFLTWEAQTLGLYSIFGNGVIDDDPTSPSWHIQAVPGDTTGQIVQITPGHGHVEWKAAETATTTVVRIPRPSSTGTLFTFYIYATPTATTPYLKTVAFVASQTEIPAGTNDLYVGLGQVQVDFSGLSPVARCYNDAEHGRVNISLFATIASIINKHRHIGGKYNPSRVSLKDHVQGKLDGSNIEHVDLSKADRGVVPARVLPTIPHGKLSDIGTLSHFEIDALLASQIIPSGYRLADLNIINTLQIVLALKKAGVTAADQRLNNAIVYIPGITSSSFVASDVPSNINLADVDTVNHRIVGTVTSGVGTDNLVWTSQRDFDSAYSDALAFPTALEPISKNIEVTNVDGGEITISKPLNYRGLLTPNLDTPDWKAGYVFTDSATKEAVAFPWQDPAPAFNNELVDTYGVERYFFTEFANVQDWSGRTHIGVGYGLSTASRPGDLCMFVLLSSGGTAVDCNVTGAVKTLNVSDLVVFRPATVTADPTRLFGVHLLTDFGLSTDDLKNVKGVGFYWNTASGWDGAEVDFYLVTPTDDEIGVRGNSRDNVVLQRHILGDTSTSVFIWNAFLYADEAVLVFRFDSNSDITHYHVVNWDVDLPASTTLQVQTRVADSQEELSTPFRVDPDTHLVPDDSRTGRWFDIIVTMRPDRATMSSAPTLSLLNLSFEGPGAAATKIWNTRFTDLATDKTGWDTTQRTAMNITVGPDLSGGYNYLTITDTTKIGQFLYVRQNNAYASSQLDGSDESVFLDGSQNGAPPFKSPVQEWNRGSTVGFIEPRDFQVLDNGHIIVADTGNDRVIEFDASGTLVRAIQGNIRLNRTNRDFVLLSAVYNPRVGKIWLSFSQNIRILDPRKIYLISGQQTITFGDAGIGAIPFQAIGGNSATIEVTLGLTVNSLVGGWLGAMRLVIDSGAVDNAGNGGEAAGGGATPPDGADPGDDLTEALGLGSLGGKTENTVGLPTYAPTETVTGDYDGDGVVSTTLQAANRQKSYPISVDVYRGEIIFDNIYAPISVQVKADGEWIVACPASDAVIAYDSLGVRLWSLNSSSAPFIDGLGGSAHEMMSGNILIALPASEGRGKVLVVNRKVNNVPLVDIPTDGDAVRAIPYANQELEYWVLVDDRANDGKSSRLLRYSSSGRVTWSWGQGIISRPTGLRILANGKVLVSE